MKKILKLFVISCLCLIPFNIKALTKTETIYSNLDNKGNVKKTTINTKLSNLDKGDVIDYTNLNNIKNINGKQKFSRDSQKLTWKSNGKDIYYQGILNDNLPIKVDVKYYLNDEEIEPNKLKGRQGSIKIIFNLENKDYDYNYGMYVPYVIDLTTSLNNKNNSNINITNGKSVSINGKTICTAISSPGIYESTKIEELKSLNSITLSYDTTKYEQSEYYFVITPKVLSEIDLDKINEINTKLSNINSLDEATEKILNGSKDLYNGEVQINNGLESLNKGIKSTLDGSTEITNGLYTIKENTSSISSLIELVNKLYDSYNKNTRLIEGIESGSTEEQLREGIANATNEKINLENNLSQVNAGIIQLEQGEIAGVLSDEEIEQLNTLRYQKSQLETGISQYEQAISEAETNLATLPIAKYKLLGANEVISQVLCGILGTDNMSNINEETINKFNENIIKLVGGIDALYNGSNKLSSGLNELYNGSNKLIDGNKKIEQGTKDLSEGIEKFKKEGIVKLTELANKATSYTKKIENLSKISKEYSGYASTNANKTIFIYKMS